MGGPRFRDRYHAPCLPRPGWQQPGRARPRLHQDSRHRQPQQPAAPAPNASAASGSCAIPSSRCRSRRRTPSISWSRSPRAPRTGRTVNWELVKPFIEITHERNDPLPSNHGTHVAGIIGASAEAAKAWAKLQNQDPHEDAADGMCPGHQALRLPRARAHAQGNRVRDHRRAAVHPLHQRALQLHHRSTAPI